MTNTSRFKTFDELTSEINTLKNQKSQLENEMAEINESAKVIESRFKKLESVLAFYADPVSYDSRHGLAIMQDGGARARQAIEGCNQ